jgi:LuxR family maltose regulon positive regulatory protein
MSDLRQRMLLRTKLYRPGYEQDVILRPDLMARLEEGLRCPFTLVAAPAGFGKSTLVSAWLEGCSTQSTWLSLDAEDNDLSVFVSYFVAAVRVLYPAACAETEALSGLATEVPVTTLAHQLINDLDALSGCFVLVLDDYDRIDHPAIHELMSILVRRPPRPLRLVVTARRDPPLPLARLRAGGLMTEVRMADLRLQPPEAAAFWHNKPRFALDDGSIAKLDSVIEGWPAALRLAAISLRLSANPQQTIDALASSNTHVQDYLFREIFASVPAPRQHALLRMALVERFCGSLADAICGVPDAGGQTAAGEGLMEWLKANNLFLVPLDDEGTWYRFHHLFQQLLRQQGAKLLAPQTVAALHACAADWFADAAMTDDALAHAFRIPSQERALAIVARQRVAVLNQEDWPRMRRWLESFSPSFFAHAPALWVIKANVLLNQFRFVELDTILERLKDFAEYAPEVGLLHSQLCLWRGEAERSLEFARAALAALPADNVHAYGNALIMVGLSLQMSGAQEAGFARLVRELGSTAPKDPVITTRVLLALAGMHWAAGNLGSMSRVAQRLLDLGEQHHLLASRSWAHFFLGCGHYWRNELSEAERHFAAVVAQPAGVHTMVFVQSHFGLILSHLAQDRAQAAQVVLDAALAWVTEAGHLSLLNLVEAFAAQFALVQGHTAAAAAWAAGGGDIRPQMPWYFLEAQTLILIRICLSQGPSAQLARAANSLEGARQFVADTHNALRIIDVLALESLLHKARREPEAALVPLAQALALAEPERIMRPFLDLGAPMAALLHETAKRGSAYAAQVLAAFPHAGVKTIARSAVADMVPQELAMDPLTDRELEVLSLLAQRLSNKEIAQILVVTPITVKSHTRNLFAKLQVNGRRAAVERAQTLGLLQ